MKKTILLLLISFCSLWSIGQQINITSFRVKSTLPAEINSWAKDPSSVLLVANKMPFQKIDQAKLVLQIRSNGNVICGYQPQELKTRDSSFTLKTFSASDLVSLLSGCQNLAPGTYQLCAQFFNADNKAVSKESCKDFTIAGTGTEPVSVTYSPPVNRSPLEGKVFTEKEATQSLVFSWTPVVPKPQRVVTYKVRVLEIRKGQSRAEALKTNTPVEILETQNATEVTSKLSKRCNGCEYIWNVEARKNSAMGDIEMLGTSEATGFSMKTAVNTDPVKYSAPVNQSPVDGKVFTKEEAAQPIVLSWTPVSPSPKGDVLYKVRVVEIKEGQSKEQALRSNKPFQVLEVTNLTQTSFKLSQRINALVWDVEAVEGNGSTVYGSSQPSSLSVNNGGCQIDYSATIDSIICKDNNQYKVCATFFINRSGFGPSSSSYTQYPTKVVKVEFFDQSLNPIGAPVPINVLRNEGNTYTGCWTITIPNTVTNLTVRFEGQVQTPNPVFDNCVNTGRADIPVPSCSCNLCDAAKWGFKSDIAYDAVTNNVLTLHNYISFGPYSVVKLSTELVDFYWYTEGDCKKCENNDYNWGNIISGNISGNNFSSQGTSVADENGIPLPGSHQMDFISNTLNGAQLNNDVYLNISLPPETQLSCCTDCFRFCIRYTVTFMQDGVCKTCSIIKCYESKRPHKRTGRQLLLNECGERIISTQGGGSSNPVPIKNKN